jgi:pyrimidine operon attenuation protein/uracil phosphoribosyltransferase
VVFAALIKRDGKQIPITPDCVGTQITLDTGQRIKLTGPEPLSIAIERSASSACK